MNPTIGRVVTYTSRTGNYVCPAIVTATLDTLYRQNVDAGHIADLTSPQHVHLTVFTPGKPGKRATAADFKGPRADAPISENVGGAYQEWDVPFDEIGTPGTWSWPKRTPEQITDSTIVR